MKKKTIKIGFMDFGAADIGFRKWIISFLEQKYAVEDSDHPDYAFYILSGQTHHYFPGVRIFWSGENTIPNFNCCDYALGFHHITFEDRYFRLPLWRTYIGTLELAQHRNDTLSDEQALQRDFCATVISNAKQTDGMREKAFEELSRYKPVASGGRWKNNVGGPVPNKIEFQKNYKFALAFENTYSPGYTTEKILEAYASGCVPIYYGDPRVTEDFNPDSFINAHDFKSLADLRQYVEEVDRDDKKYLKILRAPIFRNNQLPADLTDKAILAFLSNIFDKTPEQARRRFYSKPYQDIDIVNIKTRDIKAILKEFIFGRFRRRRQS